MKGNSVDCRILLSANRADKDAFVKVKQMFRISSEVVNEAADQAGHKAWCDTELSSNVLARKE